MGDLSTAPKGMRYFKAVFCLDECCLPCVEALRLVRYRFIGCDSPGNRAIPGVAEGDNTRGGLVLDLDLF